MGPLVPASYRRVFVILADVSLEKDGRYWDRRTEASCEAKRSIGFGWCSRPGPARPSVVCKKGLPHVPSIEASDTKATAFVLNGTRVHRRPPAGLSACSLGGVLRSAGGIIGQREEGETSRSAHSCSFGGRGSRRTAFVSVAMQARCSTSTPRPPTDTDSPSHVRS